MIVDCWNDYSEGAHIAPSVRSQYGFADLTAWLATWFKMGVEPAVTQDALLAFHRVQQAYGRGEVQPSPPRRQVNQFEAKSSDVTDTVEVWAALTAPGTVEFWQAGEAAPYNSQALPAGFRRITADLPPGRLRLRLVRP